MYFKGTKLLLIIPSSVGMNRKSKNVRGGENKSKITIVFFVLL